MKEMLYINIPRDFFLLLTFCLFVMDVIQYLSNERGIFENCQNLIFN